MKTFETMNDRLKLAAGMCPVSTSGDHCEHAGAGRSVCCACHQVLRVLTAKKKKNRK